VADQILEDRKHVLPVADDGLEDGPELRFALGFAVPFRENRSGNLNVLAEFIGRMAAEKQPIEKGRLSLRELEVLQRLS